MTGYRDLKRERGWLELYLLLQNLLIIALIGHWTKFDPPWWPLTAIAVLAYRFYVLPGLYLDWAHTKNDDKYEVKEFLKSMFWYWWTPYKWKEKK